jgi:DNA-binding IclR family transcriptional regulator
MPKKVESAPAQDRAESKKPVSAAMLNNTAQTRPAELAPAEARVGVREVSVPAVVRAAAMLRLLSNAPIPLGVNQIARDLDIIPSTCLHILRALTNEGLVAFDAATKRYGLGLEVLRLAKTALRDSIADQAQPYLDEIVRKFLVTAFAVSISEPEHYVVTAKSNSPNAIRLHVDLGSRFPALVSATGRCVAAYSRLPARSMKARFDRLRWHRAPDYEEWLGQVATVRPRGYAVDDGNYINGVYIVASPILGSDGEFRHAIVALCIKEGWSEESLRELAETVRASAGQVAEGLRLSVKSHASRAGARG